MTYQDAQPRAVDIKATVLARQMPPWGAVKGFGDFRNDQGLTQEQISLVTDWVEGGAREATTRTCCQRPRSSKRLSPYDSERHDRRQRASLVLRNAVVLDGVFPERIPEGASLQIVAALPDGECSRSCGSTSTRTAIVIRFCSASPSIFRPAR